MIKRDIELLSAYLDGELKSSDSTQLEARLKNDPELVSVLNDLRAARTLLRKLPSRKAPRNFTLTRKMVGQNPPLPRTYPLFRYATIVATLLFFFTFGINSFSSQMASPSYYGIGGSGGGGPDSFAAEAPAMDTVMTEAPAMTEEPLMQAPAAAQPEASVDATSESEPSIALAPAATQMAPTEESSRIMETPASKSADAENSVDQGQPPAVEAIPSSRSITPLISSTWQIALAVIAILSALFMALLRQLSARRWK